MATNAILRLGPSDSVKNFCGTNGISSSSSQPLLIDIGSKDELASSLQGNENYLDSFEIAVPADQLSDFLDPLALASLIPSLLPGGLCRVVVLPASAEQTLPDVEVIKTAFLLAGLNTEGERRERDGTRILVAKKPLASLGQAQAKRINIDSSSTVAKSEEKKRDDNVGTSSRQPAKVTIGNLDDQDEDEDDGLIDEDNLLDDDQDGLLIPPPVDVTARAKADDCGGRKPCDNCTCGRAEREDKGEMPARPQKLTEVPSSSCGNCAKGDAFRCASCPFLGKPAFKPGEEHLVLDLADDL